MSLKTIAVAQDLLATNKEAAAAIRRELRARGILCVNLHVIAGEHHHGIDLGDL